MNGNLSRVMTKTWDLASIQLQQQKLISPNLRQKLDVHSFVFGQT